ncbi:hypothetical protein BASA50_001783 [Batrachochytrium salamandrivorans]|uniref:PDZ domain-containing protein n=1 Tax=Batrachochytrium salamandrivorans TaxID=1357716 RepID=A0ABQ8FQV3_9FUNG|nr:hypothetical protein BASA50_001783 [Batrachochytrium salamandrivorans]
MLVFSAIALVAIGSTSVSASNYATYNLLSYDRAAGRLVFPPATLAQREIILSNVKNALTAWASYDSKIAHYNLAADSFPIVKNLCENIDTVTDEGLHLGITDAFAMARGRHTRLTNMAPYDCFHTTTEDYSKIQAGDELLAINGLSFVDWFKQNKFKSGFGANDIGGQRTGLGFLTTIYGEKNHLPNEDSITFQFKPHASPQTSYTVNVPYVSIHDDECWNLGGNLYKSITSITLPGTPETSLPVNAEQSGHNHESGTAQLFLQGLHNG